MPTNDIIASVLALSTDERLAVLDAIHVSLADPSLKHGPLEEATVVATAWKDEIARRIDDLDAGRIETIPAVEAEEMIRNAKLK